MLRNIIYSIITVFFCSSFALSAQVNLKVMSWNILSFEKTDKSGERNGFLIDDFVNHIKSVNPDVLCLNEFETGTSRMGKEKMAELASTLNMYAYFIESYPKDAGFYGNVILSRFPIRSSKSMLFPYKNNKGAGYYQHNDGKELEQYGADQRSVGYADIIIPDSDGKGTIIRIVCAHFDHQGSGDVIPNQCQKSVEFASLDKPEYPTIMCGDFNTSMAAGALEPFLKAGEQMSNFWVDYIFAFPQGKWKSAGDGNNNHVGNLSDHSSISVSLTLND